MFGKGISMLTLQKPRFPVLGPPFSDTCGYVCSVFESELHEPTVHNTPG